MPIYEYFCQSCDGVFELLRPIRDAHKDAPCPECEREVKRIVSRDFAAFTTRDGAPRRLPDDGTFWHHGQKVSTPVNGPSYMGLTHPELESPGDIVAPSLEEVEGWEHTLSERTRVSKELGIEGRVIDSEFEREKRAFAERLTSTRGPTKVERAKRRLLGPDDGGAG